MIDIKKLDPELCDVALLQSQLDERLNAHGLEEGSVVYLDAPRDVQTAIYRLYIGQLIASADRLYAQGDENAAIELYNRARNEHCELDLI